MTTERPATVRASHVQEAEPMYDHHRDHEDEDIIPAEVEPARPAGLIGMTLPRPDLLTLVYATGLACEVWTVDIILAPRP